MREDIIEVRVTRIGEGDPKEEKPSLSSKSVRAAFGARKKLPEIPILEDPSDQVENGPTLFDALPDPPKQ